jgi:hypothetical protein
MALTDLVGQDTSAGTPPATPFEKTQAELKARLDAIIKVQDNLVASLDSRQGAGNPFFALAQGFLAPTKGGGFGESAGNAMQMFGAQQQQQQKQDQDTAMMRMQLAQASLAPAKEKYTMERENAMGQNLRAQLGGGANAVAGSSGATAGGVTAGGGATGGGGAGNAGAFSSMPESVRQAIFYKIGIGDSAGADKLRDQWVLDDVKKSDEQRRVEFLARTQPNPAVAIAGLATEFFRKPTLENEKLIQDAVIATAQGGANIANIVKGLPPELAAIVMKSLEKLQALGSPTGNAKKPNDAQGAPIGNKFEGTREQALSDLNHPRNAGMNTNDRVAVTDAINNYFNRLTAVKTGTPPAVRTGSSNPALSMQAQEDVKKKQLELEAQTEQKAIQDRQALIEKPWEQHRSDIFGWTPTVNKNGIRDLDELANIASISPNVFNLLRGSGWWTALQAAAQEGAQAGKLGSFSLPTEKYIETKNLNPQEKINLNRAAKILANQFFENAKQNKSVLGPSISNSDTVLLRAPVATPSDPAASIIYWAKEHSLFYKQRQELYTALHDWDEKVGPKKPLGMFFNSPQYNEIADKYNYYLNDLRQKSSPVR